MFHSYVGRLYLECITMIVAQNSQTILASHTTVVITTKDDDVNSFLCLCKIAYRPLCFGEIGINMLI